MFPRFLSDRVETLIDELIAEGGVVSASLASILVAAHQSVHQGHSMELSRRVWHAWSELRPSDHEDDRGTPQGNRPVGGAYLISEN